MIADGPIAGQPRNGKPTVVQRVQKRLADQAGDEEANDDVRPEHPPLAAGVLRAQSPAVAGQQSVAPCRVPLSLPLHGAPFARLRAEVIGPAVGVERDDLRTRRVDLHATGGVRNHFRSPAVLTGKLEPPPRHDVVESNGEYPDEYETGHVVSGRANGTLRSGRRCDSRRSDGFQQAL